MREFHAKDKRRAIVELQKDELLYDIKNTAYILADTQRSADLDSHRLLHIYDIAEPGNRDRLARVLDASVEDCKEFLFRYTKVEMCDDALETDAWKDCVGSPDHREEAYYIAMRVPKDFSSTTVHTMAVYIHDYIVYQVMYEWLTMVMPELAERYQVLLAEKKEKIKEASNRSAGHVRIKLHPF